MVTIDAILALHKAGYSNRKIGELLDVDRETVGKYLAQAELKAATPDERAPRLADESTAEAPAVVAPQEPSRSSGPASECEPYRELILAKLRQGLSATRIHQDLREEAGFAASYYSVRRYVGRLEAKSELPVRRLETAPGEQAQVDFGAGAMIRGADGARRRPWVFRIVLSYSRKGDSEAVYRQSSEAFINCLENAFAHFGGVPQTLVIDNLKAVVAKADWYDPEIHPRLQSFAAHYGTVFLPTKPYTPRHKGKIESGVKYVQSNALQGRSFASLTEENQFLLDWETRVADTRLHGTIKRQVGPFFEECERGALLPLPRDRFPFFHEARRTVHRDGHIEVEKAYYSVPPEHLGRRLWVRWDSRLVRVFDEQFRQIALHAKAEPGRFRTAGEHISSRKISAVERGAEALLRQVSAIGPHTQRWAEALVQARGVEAVRVLVGLKALANQHRSDALEQACQTALSYGAYRLRTIRQLLQHQQPPQPTLEFLEEHPIIRPLSEYALDSFPSL
jgi:transposase